MSIVLDYARTANEDKRTSAADRNEGHMYLSHSFIIETSCLARLRANEGSSGCGYEMADEVRARASVWWA